MLCRIFHPGVFLATKPPVGFLQTGGKKAQESSPKCHQKLRFRKCTSNLHLEHLDDFYGRTNWGVTVAAWDICIFFDLTHGLFWNLWVSMMGTNRLYGKFHNLTRRNILKPHPPKPCLPKFCTKGPWLDGDEILARRNWESVFSKMGCFWVFCSLKMNQKHHLTVQPNPKNTLEILFLEQRKHEMQKETHFQTNQPTIIHLQSFQPKTVAWLAGNFHF